MVLIRLVHFMLRRSVGLTKSATVYQVVLIIIQTPNKSHLHLALAAVHDRESAKWPLDKTHKA